MYLNLVLEFIPETVYRVARHYNKQKQTIPISFIKLYMYQLFRSLAYIHSLGICHRDIKPQNLLLDPETGVLKLCDFGRCVLFGHLFDDPFVLPLDTRFTGTRVQASPSLFCVTRRTLASGAGDDSS